MRGFSRAVLVLVFGAAPAAGFAQTTPPVAQASRLTGLTGLAGSIAVDGRLDEPAWQQAAGIRSFRQYQPSEGAQASLPMTVRVLYDDQALYIGAEMSEPSGVAAPLARRDQLLDSNGNNGAFNSLTSDKLVVHLDPYHNHLDDALFEVNPAGVKGDQFDGDPSWDPVWEAAAHTDALGWTAEMRIPFSQLRFSRDPTQVWGLQIWRYIDRLNERDMWSFWTQKTQGGPVFFGELDGLTINHRPRQMELLPYVVGGGTLQYATPGDPFHGGHDMNGGVGADLKYLLTSNLTLDATLHPDFGQVEVDPASLNLSADETYYDEKRPFFIAGSSAFDFGGMRCMFCSNSSSLGAFYSRRIGRPPQLETSVTDHAQYADVPDNTAILGAAKVTGRTQRGYTIGLLDAVTSQETARFLPVAGAVPETQVAEPFANYFVGRVKKDFGKGSTWIGGILTSTVRNIPDVVARDALHSHAEAAGLDWTHFWHHHDYSWMGSVLFSDVAGSPASIAATEQSSAHYFQRPDRTVTSDGLFGTRDDAAATALRGYGVFTRVGKDGGSWRWEAMSNVRSPGFEVNDLSFLNRADYVWLNGNVARTWTTPTRWYRNIFTSFGGATQSNYDGDRTWSQWQWYYGQSFPNYWNLRLFAIRNIPAYDDRLTRGGPVVRRAGYDFGHFQISTDARRPAVFDFTVEAVGGIDAPTHSITISPGMAFKPAASLFVQLGPSFANSENDAQYVTAVADPAASAFDGTRYVFGFVHTRTVSLDTRVNWTLTPNLTLQLYAQPFVAGGDYTSFREFAQPRTIDKIVFGRDAGTVQYDPDANAYTIDPDGTGAAAPFSLDNPDFTSTSLRGTAVVRWEYRPGSTLFFVWTQQRSGSDPSGDFDFARATHLIQHDRATNVFQVKATFWIGR